MAEPADTVGLYVHWPFCQAKCPYCDFNSHVAGSIDQRRWAAALAQEVAHAARRAPGRRLGSIFFGGGTPSTMDAATVAAIMDAASAGWPMANDIEVTLEANPTSVDAERFAGYRAAGVNRVSLGVQALNDADLKRLGRLHSVAEARAAFDVARAAFDRVSFDLICGRQDQSLAAWQAELDEALAMAVDHVALYQLTIEPGTAFADRLARGGLRGLPDEDLAADMYEATVDRCARAGLHLYEVSNFARPGAECRHNMLYWSGGDYIGVGPGAHGRISADGDRVATVQESLPSKWLDSVERGATDHHEEDRISLEDQYVEYLMMGLRTLSGVSLQRLSDLRGGGAALGQRAETLASLGLLEVDRTHVRATSQGRQVLDSILSDLLVA